MFARAVKRADLLRGGTASVGSGLPVLSGSRLGLLLGRGVGCSAVSLVEKLVLRTLDSAACTTGSNAERRQSLWLSVVDVLDNTFRFDALVQSLWRNSGVREV
jgi:hypothetical protein